MNWLKRWMGSIRLLSALCVVFVAVMVATISPIGEHVADRSLSVVDNFLLVGGFMVLLTITGVIEMLLVKRLIWGAPSPDTPGSELSDDGDDVNRKMRSMKATGTKLGVLLVVLLIVNIAVFDSMGRGVLFSNTRAYWVLTLLRSPSADDRMEAISSAILLIGDEVVAEALKRVIEQPGEGREWAAYAAGVRNDTALGAALEKLLLTGNLKECAAAAVALARMEDARFVRHLEPLYERSGEHRDDVIKAVGYLGKKGISHDATRKATSAFLLDLLLGGMLKKQSSLLVVWALGKLESPEAYTQLETYLEPKADLDLLCTTLEALGRIGSVSSSAIMVGLIYKVDREARCREIVYRDFAEDEVLLSGGLNLVQRLIREIARIGDREAKPTMDALAKDMSFSKQVRSMAAEVAFLMKYKH